MGAAEPSGATAAEHDGGASSSEEVARVSYLAIRQPAVIRHLEAALATADGDALAAGLELACRIVEQIELADGVAAPRLDHAVIDRGVLAVEAGTCDAALVGWVGGQLAQLPLVLDASEERRVSTAIAAVLWALADRRRDDEMLD